MKVLREVKARTITSKVLAVPKKCNELRMVSDHHGRLRAPSRRERHGRCVPPPLFFLVSSDSNTTHSNHYPHPSRCLRLTQMAWDHGRTVSKDYETWAVVLRGRHTGVQAQGTFRSTCVAVITSVRPLLFSLWLGSVAYASGVYVAIVATMVPVQGRQYVH